MVTLDVRSEDRLHSAESAAALLDVRSSTIRFWWSSGKPPRVKIGRLSRVRESKPLAMIGPESDRPEQRGTSAQQPS